MQTYCHYTVEWWQRVRSLSREGRDDEPQWPDGPPYLDEDERLGTRRDWNIIELSALSKSGVDEKTRKHWVCVEKPCDRS